MATEPGTLIVGDRVCCPPAQMNGTIAVIWPDGACYVDLDDGTRMATGLSVLTPEDGALPQPQAKETP